MRVLVGKNDVEILKEQILKANKDCNICPVCGEKENIEYSHSYIENAGMGESIHTDFYRCKSCFSEWESEMYKPSVVFGDREVCEIAKSTLKPLLMC